jgi:hypothetical protein
MFPITITIANQVELNAVMAALVSGSPAPSVGRGQNASAAAPQEPAEKKSTKAQATTPAKTQETSAPTQPTAEAAGAGAPESKAANSDAAQSGSEAEGAWNTRDGYKDSAEYQAVAKAVVGVARAKGREAAATLLEQVAGVKSLPEAKPSQAQAIIDAFKAGV